MRHGLEAPTSSDARSRPRNARFVVEHLGATSTRNHPTLSGGRDVLYRRRTGTVGPLCALARACHAATCSGCRCTRSSRPKPPKGVKYRSELERASWVHVRIGQGWARGA